MKWTIQTIPLEVLAWGLLLVSGLTAQATSQPLLPFDNTGDLFVLDSGCGCILSITPDTVTIAVTREEILAATGGAPIGFLTRGIAFDAAGALYFTGGDEATSTLGDVILKKEPNGPVSVLTSEAAMLAASGETNAVPRALAIGSDGFLYVNVDWCDCLMRVDPITGTPSVFVSQAAFRALPGIDNADLDGGIVGGEGGSIFTAADDVSNDPLSSNGNAIFTITPGGIPSVLTIGDPFGDLDAFMTRAPNGDLIVADDGSDSVYRVSPSGVVSTFLPQAVLETTAEISGQPGTGIDLEAGIVFDSMGNFYIVVRRTLGLIPVPPFFLREDAILKFDTSLNGSIWVSAADIEAVTGVTPVLVGGIAFAPCGVLANGLDTCLLKKGDILFRNTKIPEMWGYWEHVGVYVGDGKTVDALPFVPSPLPFLPDPPLGAVVFGNVEDYGQAGNDWAIKRIPDEIKAEVLAEFAKGLVGVRPYGWANLLATAQPPFPDLRDDLSLGVYCSQLVYLGGKVAGLDLDGGTWPFNPAVTPDEIYQDSDVILVDERPGITRTVIIAGSPVNLLLLDSQGRSAGVDPITGAILDDIPGVLYSGPAVEPEYFAVENLDGPWTLQVSGTGTGSFTLFTENIETGNHQTASVTGTAFLGSLATYLVRNPSEPVAIQLNVHAFLLLADKQVHISADSLMMGQSSSDGDIHANDKIHFHKGNMSTHTGNLTAVKDIKVDKDNTINGDATAGGKVDLKGSAVVNGTVTENAAVAVEVLPTLSFTAGGSKVTVEEDESQSLAPGSYGKIKVKKRGTLELSHDGASGDYFFEELDLKDDTKLTLDVSNGPITINSVKHIHFHKNAEVEINSPFGSESRFVTFNCMKKVDVHDGARVLGSIIAPKDKVHLKKNVLFQGSICAKDIHIDKGSTILHHDSSIPLPLAKAAGSEEDAEELTTIFIPTEFALEQNYPNPFNPSTTISFGVPEASEVKLAIYNMRGQLIQTLQSGFIAAGQHSVVWDGTDFRGAKVASGIYVYRLEGKGIVVSKKLVFTK